MSHVSYSDVSYFSYVREGEGSRPQHRRVSSGSSGRGGGASTARRGNTSQVRSGGRDCLIHKETGGRGLPFNVSVGRGRGKSG